ncbi:uncharacterized protein N7482_004288 [Penicillium canariense]|uniref:Uncharacterized protein n=1 Tax=Penicillium canariense TaxID=189055 RepID=A0A9W9I8H4_9EURO|nr:uncharacterized protein N7482_004288 [Penicillium canariense]KAJ5168694.1 hypothetical protein N7482_004288 [Penicillium canariense]
MEIEPRVSPFSIYDSTTPDAVVRADSAAQVAFTEDTSAQGPVVIEGVRVTPDIITITEAWVTKTAPTMHDNPVTQNTSLTEFKIAWNAAITNSADNLPVTKNAPITDPEDTQDTLTTDDAAIQNDKVIGEDFVQARPPKADAVAPDTGPIDSNSPERELSTSTAIGKQPLKRLTAAPDTQSLPGQTDILNDAQIADLCSLPPRIRQLYSLYFNHHGVIRTEYLKNLFERLPSGELRHPEDILRSCVPKWKTRLENFERQNSSQLATGQTNETQGTLIPAKRGIENTTSPKEGKKPAASKGTPGVLSTGSRKPGASPSAGRLSLTLSGPSGSRRTALTMGPPPPGALSTQNSSALSASHPGSHPRDTSNLALENNQEIKSGSNEGHGINQCEAPVMDFLSPNFERYPGHFTHKCQAGGIQLLELDNLSRFIKWLTGEVHQLDYFILSAAQLSHDRHYLGCLRDVWDRLVYLRDACMEMEAQLKDRMDSKN